MSSYTKLFSSILDSTIWQEPDHVRIVWITLLAMKDIDGIVEASIPGLAKRAGKGIDETLDALRVLMGPDPYSRTRDDEGRRVAEIEGGWRVLNHDKYRDAESKDEVRAKGAARKARYRERARLRDMTGQSGTSGTSPACLRSPRDPDPDPDPDQKKDLEGDILILNPNPPPAQPSPLKLLPGGQEEPPEIRAHAQTRKPRPEPSTEAFTLADYLRDKILATKPDHRLSRGTWQGSATRRSWAATCDTMHRIDRREWRRSAELVAWVFGPNLTAESSFVVESPTALRAKWDRLDVAASKPARVARGNAGGQTEWVDV